MKHEAGLECTIRKEGVGDREAWGRWWLEELEKKEGQGAEKRRCKGGRRWCADVLMRRGQSHDLPGEWFRDDWMPAGRGRRRMQLVVGSFACGAWGDGTIDKQRRDRCSMWRRGVKIQREPKVGEEEVPLATVVHISSAGCRASHRGQKEVAALARKDMFREVMLDAARHQRGKDTLGGGGAGVGAQGDEGRGEDLGQGA